MPATLGRRFTFVSLLLLGGGGTTQAQSAGAEPLRKSDLLRLLSVGTLGSGELAALVRRTCLSFTPTSRDRADLVALGAVPARSEEHTSELQSHSDIVCRLLLEEKERSADHTSE